MNRTSSHDLEDRCASITLARQGDRADSNRLPPGSQPGPSTTSGSVTAEGMGFEPTRPLAQSHGLANRPDQPYSATFRSLSLRAVERRGIEPRFPGCKPGVVPLDQRPIRVCSRISSRSGSRTRRRQALDLAALPICVPDCGSSESWIRTKRNRAYETQPGCLPLANVLLSPRPRLEACSIAIINRTYHGAHRGHREDDIAQTPPIFLCALCVLRGESDNREG